ncbi:acetyl-CoA hydrolase/transferase C-terminal domain-containing protein [Pseudomonas sp. CG7]|uniref:acetyl-CoA hydrolase/transferase family protein n=1 Tax=Pseudomonas sp. CG7 TaxID=191007 RepID=UPI002033BCFE|nr:acetyl-CoA hydrolase/transferase C-terminal domain-containing protein [Pseudomonas sp. CG7]
MLMEQRAQMGRFRVMLGITHSDTCRPEHADQVDFISYCGGGANRALAKAGVLDILPCHYSQFPEMIRDGTLKIDVLLLQLAPPDEQGRYSLSLAHEYLLPALEHARLIIAEVNHQAPWTFGERYLYEEDLDCIVETSRSPLESPASRPGPIEQAIASQVAGLIEDGSTLQFGLGVIPEAILSALGGHRNLGVHSGAIGDGVVDLMEKGVINNIHKTIDRGATIAGVLMGSNRLNHFAHCNAAIQMRSTAYTHDLQVLGSLERFVALNSAIEVDLSGQINAETAGGTYIGAVGGALDFLRGARRSRGGLPIIALPSVSGIHSRIVSRINGPVSTPRSDAGLIVTEYGVADLRGLSLRQRRLKMLDIAHPDFREQLEQSASL